MDNPAAGVVGEYELVERVLVKVRHGRKVWPLATQANVSPYVVYTAAHEGDIRLKRGRPTITPLNGGSLEDYRKCLSRRYWPGFAGEFLAAAEIKSFGELAEDEKYRSHGLRTRQRLQQIYSELTLGRRKPRQDFRRDITKERLEALSQRYGSKTEIARALAASQSTVTRRAKEFGVDLPDALLAERARIAKLRGEAKILREKGWPARQIAHRLGVHCNTIFLWNKGHRLRPRQSHA